MMRTLFAAALVLALAACAAPQDEGVDSPPELPPLDSEIELPQLALADHMLGTYFASDVAMRPTVCIATTDGREDVALEAGWERELMARYPALAPFARCALLEGAWQDAETGEPAMVFSLHTFTCATASSCSGYGQYMFGRTGSPTSRYQLEWGGKRWVFTRDDRLLGAE